MLRFRLNDEDYRIRTGDYVFISFDAERWEYCVQFSTAKYEPLRVGKYVRWDYVYSECLTFAEHLDREYERNLKHLLGGVILEHYAHPQHFKLQYRIIKAPH